MGQVTKPTLDPNKPISFVDNSDGTTSTVLTISIGIDGGRELLIPMVKKDGTIFKTEEKAIEHARRTGEHFGIYDSVASANAAGAALSKHQSKTIKRKR